MRDGTVSLANEMMYGERAVTVRARLMLTAGGGAQVKGLIKLMGGFSGFALSGNIKPSRAEYEVWDCDILIVPRRIHRDGPYKGWRIDQVMTDMGNPEERFKKHEDVKP
jgi:hypothetical protein